MSCIGALPENVTLILSTVTTTYTTTHVLIENESPLMVRIEISFPIFSIKDQRTEAELVLANPVGIVVMEGITFSELIPNVIIGIYMIICFTCS